MRIVVCIKQVPVVAAMELDPQTLALKREGVRTEVSAFDLRAVVKAVDLARAHGGEVTVLTMGPPQAREALLECLALGADRAVHLCDRAFAGSDTLATARALAAALRRTSFDLVLCGRNSTDAETGQVGPEVAELLDLPQVTSVRSLEVDPGTRTLRAERETDEGFETVVASLPALVTAAEDIRAADLDVPVERLGAAGSPTWVAGLQALEETRAGEIVTGESPEAAVEALVARLLRIGLFRSLEVEQRRPAAEGDGPVQRASARDVLVVG
jgi:electron transfer flavoprotein alpha/beta subunit